jgi:hypothetical protein
MKLITKPEIQKTKIKDLQCRKKPSCGTAYSWLAVFFSRLKPIFFNLEQRKKLIWKIQVTEKK